MNDRYRVRRGAWARMYALAVLAFALANGSGYVLMGALYHLTGSPPEWARHVLSGIVGLLLVMLSGFIFSRIHRRHGEKIDWNGHARVLDGYMEAMNRIAHGDFSVLVPVNEDDPFANLAEAINKMARELGSMEKLRQDFISNVSHEIQSPLTSIGGFAALLRQGELSDERRGHYLDIIGTEATRLSRLSDNLLKLSSLESGVQQLTIAPFALHRQIENAVLMLEPQWADKHLEMDLALERLSLCGDEELLSQVWINVLGNAVKFTPAGGTVHVSLAREGEMAVCCVADSGSGIAPEDLIHVFERFYKADKARDRSLGGNGLGLSIAKKIVELHGGTVFAESEVELGSTFTVRLPIEAI